MQVGFAEMIITPPNADCLLAGYALYPATGVHDELYASALYLVDAFSDHERHALLISYDLLAMEKELIARIKAGICATLPLTADAIFLTCTHTHEGPEVRERKFRDRWYGEERPAYLDHYLAFLTQKSVEVAQSAVAASQPCELRVNRAYLDENMNRRFFLPDGSYLGVPDHKDLTPVTYGHTDRELGILAFCHPGERRPLGLLLNYTMHPLTAGQTSSLISADVPGVVRDLIKESTDCLPIYTTGAAGDNHPKAPEAGFAEARRVGEAVATAAMMRAYDAHPVAEPLRLRTLTRTVSLQLRTREEFEQIPRTGMGDGVIDGNLCRVATPGATVDVEFSLLAIGPVLLVGVPGELDSELGSMLKWFSPFKHTYILYQATDSLDYIAHPNAYLWGGFEAFCGQLSPSAVRPLINAILDAADALANAS